MKITQKIMMAALITSVLSGSADAVYDADNQDTTTVSDLKDVGLANPTRLSITRAGINAILDARFDPTQGRKDSAKNAKAFLSGVVHGTMDRFAAGADEPTRRGAFLAALDNVLAIANPLELDITAAGFNPGIPASTEAVREAVDIFFSAISPIDQREALLREAHTLGINSSNATGETVEDLLHELSVAATPMAREAVLAKVTAPNFGKAGDKSLADKVVARFRHHSPTGKHAAFGLEGDASAIAAFYRKTSEAKRAGKAVVRMEPEAVSSRLPRASVPSVSDDALAELTHLREENAALKALLAKKE